MSTKVKGLIRGIKNISSQIFDDKEEEKEEIKIGQPTDVKHLAHIGSDGPTMESPSWMKGFDSSKDFQSGPLDKTGTTVETPQVKWVSEDSGHRRTRRNGSNHRSSQSVETSKDGPLVPRSSRNRRRSVDNCRSMDNNSESQGKVRHPRRHQSEGRTRSQNPKSGDELKTDSRRKSTRRRHKAKEESSSDGPTRSPTKSTADDSDVGSNIV